MLVLALLAPPLALLLAGRPFQAVFNGILWVAGVLLTLLPFLTGLPAWLAAIGWAMAVVFRRRQSARDRRLIAEAIAQDRAVRGA